MIKPRRFSYLSWLIVAFLLKLAALSYGLHYVVKHNRYAPFGGARAKPMHEIDQPVLTRSDFTGQPLFVLRANRMQHRGETRAAELKGVRFCRFQQGKLDLEARADRARYQDDNAELQLEGDVRLRREVPPNRSPYTLLTQTLQVWLDTGLAYNDAPVTILSEGQQLQGIGVDYDTSERKFSLRKQVRTLYEPISQMR